MHFYRLKSIHWTMNLRVFLPSKGLGDHPLKVTVLIGLGMPLTTLPWESNAQMSIQ